MGYLSDYDDYTWRIRQREYERKLTVQSKYFSTISPSKPKSKENKEELLILL